MALKKRRPESRFMIKVRSSKYGIYIFYLSVFLALLLFAGAVYFYIYPYIKSHIKKEDPIIYNEFVEAVDESDKSDEPEIEDLSAKQQDVRTIRSTCNDPYFNNSEMVFSSGIMSKGVFRYKELFVYYSETEETQQITNINIEHDNIINCLITDDYLVYIDSCEAGGGRILGYNRRTDEQFLVKEYLYSAPRISIDGNLIAFMQQTGDHTDKLYVFDLENREGLCLKTFKSESRFPSSAYIFDGRVVCSVTSTSGDEVKSSIYLFNLAAGSSKEIEVSGDVYYPCSNGRYTVYLSNMQPYGGELWIANSNGKSEKLKDNVVNCFIGNGFVAYTQDETIFAYVFETGKTYRISSSLTRGVLASVSGNEICWYDITSGFGDMDLVKHLTTSFGTNGEE